VLDVTSGKITVSIATALSGFNRIIVVSVLPNLLLTKITAAVTSRRIAITRANKRSRSQFTERCTPASQLFAFLTQAPSARRRCGLWREESVDFSSAFYKLKGVTIAPKPVQPDLPMWIGGSTDAAIRRTARIGTGWQVGGDPPAEARRIVAAIKAAATEAGRSIDEDHYGAGFAFHLGSRDAPASAGRWMPTPNAPDATPRVPSWSATRTRSSRASPNTSTPACQSSFCGH
jgi:hypothetical protein